MKNVGKYEKITRLKASIKKMFTFVYQNIIITKYLLISFFRGEGLYTLYPLPLPSRDYATERI